MCITLHYIWEIGVTTPLNTRFALLQGVTLLQALLQVMFHMGGGKPREQKEGDGDITRVLYYYILRLSTSSTTLLALLLNYDTHCNENVLFEADMCTKYIYVNIYTEGKTRYITIRNDRMQRVSIAKLIDS